MIEPKGYLRQLRGTVNMSQQGFLLIEITVSMLMLITFSLLLAYAYGHSVADRAVTEKRSRILEVMHQTLEMLHANTKPPTHMHDAHISIEHTPVTLHYRSTIPALMGRTSCTVDVTTIKASWPAVMGSRESITMQTVLLGEQ